MKSWSPNGVGDVGTQDVGGAEEMITLEFKIVLSSKTIFGLNLEVTEYCNTSYMLSLSLSYSILLKKSDFEGKDISFIFQMKDIDNAFFCTQY